jgi:hypothetical protein
MRELVASGARLRRPFPNGATIVRETLDAAAGFVRVLFIMRKILVRRAPAAGNSTRTSAMPPTSRSSG